MPPKKDPFRSVVKGSAALEQAGRGISAKRARKLKFANDVVVEFKGRRPTKREARALALKAARGQFTGMKVFAANARGARALGRSNASRRRIVASRLAKIGAG
jgi:hypothetical protein